jgi:hypothetical protein
MLHGNPRHAWRGKRAAAVSLARGGARLPGLGLGGAGAACGLLEEVGRAVRSALSAAPPAPPRAVCRLAGLDDVAADQAGLVVAGFNRANPMNLAALAVPQAARRTGQAPAATSPPRPRATPRPALAVPRTATLAADTVALMHFLAVHGGRRRVAAMPTLWSVLAAHPAALALAAAALAPGFANGSIAAAARALSRRVEQAVSALPMAPAPVPDRAAVLHLQRIAPFFAAPPIEVTSGDLHAATRAATRFTFGGGLAGIPGLALPCGFDAAGLPIGVLFEAAWGHETTLLRVGEAWQQASDWHLRRPTGLG